MSNVDINVDRRTDGQKIGRLYRTLLQAGAIKNKINAHVYNKKKKRLLDLYGDIFCRDSLFWWNQWLRQNNLSTLNISSYKSNNPQLLKPFFNFSDFHLPSLSGHPSQTCSSSFQCHSSPQNMCPKIWKIPFY